MITDQIIRTLGLKPHPEGGYFRETYRSAGRIDENCLDDQYTGSRNHATCIYFLLTSDTFSAFHRIIQDETWHFYDGSPLALHTITSQGEHATITIGRNITQGQVPQYTVPGGTWFAAKVIDHDSFTLLGCTVSPGFDFADFEMGDRDMLIRTFPQHKQIIRDLTRIS
jgi:predicted cupin superfamily sugar epimerase